MDKSEPVGQGIIPEPPGVRLISANRCYGIIAVVVIKDAPCFPNQPAGATNKMFALCFASAFAGNYNISNSNWNNWGSNGNWWYGSGGQNFNGNSNGMNTNSNTNNWFSVRCVQKYGRFHTGLFFIYMSYRLKKGIYVEF